MKLKYNCKVYDRHSEEFATIPCGTEITVKEIDNHTVKIEWYFKDKKYYGFIGHRQFLLCVDTNEMERI